VVAGMRSQLAARRAEIDAGAEPLGWKLGMGGPAALAALGTTGALVGYLLADNVLADGAQVAVGAWGDPRFEPELAVRLDSAGAIDAVAVAIEIADLGAVDGVEEILAANVFQRHVILGEPRSPGELPTHSAVLRDGEQIDATDNPLIP